MLFAIHAFEQRYNGMHGIENYEVIEADSDKEAEEYAGEMSLGVIEDFLYKEFEEEALEAFEGCSDEDKEADFDDYIYNEMETDIDYEIRQVKNNTGYSLDALNNMFYNNPEEFINIYCN